MNKASSSTSSEGLRLVNINGETTIQTNLRKQYMLTVAFIALTLCLGLLVTFLPFEPAESALLVNFQTLVRNSIGILPFQILTYLGDVYVWVVIAAIYFVYAFLKSRKSLNGAVELAVFLVTVSILTVIFKFSFNRPRPNNPNLTVYSVETDPAYQSGHVSRATGGFIILSDKKRFAQALAGVAIFIVSLSRMLLGVHFLTDVIGAVFLSLAAQSIAKILVAYLRVPEWLSHFKGKN